MTIKYKLEESDYLDNQLFIASNSDRINKKRRNAIIKVPIVYLGLAIIGFYIHSSAMSVAFVILSALWYFLYPKYQTKNYYNHYKSFVAENNKEICDLEITIELSEDFIICQDVNTESKILIKSINKIFELPSVFLLNLNKASNLVISKRKPQNDQNQIQELINELNTKHNIEIHNHKDWKWE